jgi:hypothetical protein
VDDAAGAVAAGAFVKIGSSANATAAQVAPAKSADADSADFNKPHFFIFAPSGPGDGDGASNTETH